MQRYAFLFETLPLVTFLIVLFIHDESQQYLEFNKNVMTFVCRNAITVILSLYETFYWINTENILHLEIFHEAPLS